MFNRIYRLVDTHSFVCFQRELIIDEDTLIVKPIYLSICQADQRYFSGKRSKQVMREKLPMALIHEGVCEVVFDKLGEYKNGEKVVVVPNSAYDGDFETKGNYKKNSKFMSSNADGLMQDIVKVDRRCVVRVNDEVNDIFIYAMTELMSVAYNALDGFVKALNGKKFDSVGIWGDGSVSYAVALVLKNEFPEVEISIIGKHNRKLNMFGFVENTYDVTDIDNTFEFDHCFECVGGSGSENAIEQIIDVIKPQGIISLLGVSENYISINTREVLTKGLTLLGHSRSEKVDFEKSVELIRTSEYTRYYLEQIIENIVSVNSIENMVQAFNQDSITDFKTLMKWNV